MSDNNSKNEEEKSQDETDIISQLTEDIFSGDTTNDFLGLSSAHLENVSYHDFSQYLYALNPITLEPEADILSLSQINQYLEEPEDRIFVSELFSRFKCLVDNIIRTYGWFYYLFFPIPNAMLIYERIINNLIVANNGLSYDELKEYFEWLVRLGTDPRQFFDWIFGFFVDSSSFLHAYPFVYNIYIGITTTQFLQDKWNYAAYYAEAHWKPICEDIEEGVTIEGPLYYYFSAFAPNTFNFGLKLIYRQEWRPLGNQRGEIVRTIPLGPKQVEKVSTKIIRRKKITRTEENLKSIEQTSEVADTTKDSSEIVNEAAETSGWNMEAEASLSLGSVFSASISGGMHEESEKRSRETSNNLSEVMQKTASKIRTETKTIVSVESESTLEMTTASEIENANEEIAITYIYSKLQRQYEIFTYLAESQDVIFIAEPIPQPYEINFDWVKRYDWIIAKVILDDSFRDALTSISQNPSVKKEDDEGLVNDFSDTMVQVQDFFKDFAGRLAGTTGETSGIGGGLSLAGMDIIQEGQKNYRDALEKRYENRKLEKQLEHKRKRLYQHIRDNMLHYCRAIWSQEDPQQRILRYKKIGLKFPLEWDFIGTFGQDEYTGEKTLQDLLNQVKIHETDGDATTTFELEGEFVANGESGIDITDIINPVGPIGYFGNYSIYHVKPEFYKSGFSRILQIIKTPYLYYESSTAEPIFMEPTLKRLTTEFKGEGPKNDDERDEMIELIPELRVQFSQIDLENKDELDMFYSTIDFTSYYPEYLFRKDRIRKFVVDTNNLLIDIQPGKGTALESFKLAHRGIDVLKTLEEKKEIELENRRRKHLLRKQKYDSKYWPGAQKILIFDTKSEDKDEDNESDKSNSEETTSGSYGYPLSELNSLKKLASKLEVLGIETTLDLLRRSKKASDRKNILKALAINAENLTELLIIVDLMRIKGISEDEATILKEVGIDSITELSRKKATDLHAKIKAYAIDKDLSVPDELDVLKWIEQAKTNLK